MKRAQLYLFFTAVSLIYRSYFCRSNLRLVQASVLLLFGLLFMGSASATMTQVVYPKQTMEGELPANYDYFLALIEAALRATSEEGAYQIKSGEDFMTEGRIRMALSRPDYEINVHWLPYTDDIENQMHYLPFDVSQGMLGYRTLITNQRLLKELKLPLDLNGLRQYHLGQGEHWRDIQVLRDNGLAVETSPQVASLMPMVAAGRFDFFSYGALEMQHFPLWQQRYPNLVVVPNTLLHYPWPRVIVVSQQQPELAQRLWRGLTRVVQSGEFEALFEQHHRQALAVIRSSDVIPLQNAILPRKALLDLHDIKRAQ